MRVRAAAVALLASVTLAAAHNAAGQDAKPVTENELKEVLIWNSPWDGRSTSPPGLYSYRHVFRQRRDALVAEVTSLSTNQRSDSVVSIRDGSFNWRDSDGADVSVALGASGELVGTARNGSANLPIVLKPRR